MKRMLAILSVVVLLIAYSLSNRGKGLAPSGASDSGASEPGSGATAQAALTTNDVPWDQEFYFDDDGLIVHNKIQDEWGNHWDGGDTAQREGFYWFGVWVREHALHQPWPYKRDLTFDQVLNLLEHGENNQKDGAFFRHPKIKPYNNPWDKKWGFSRDQMVPLVAAMGVWGKHAELKRLWDRLPQDRTGKHTFNGGEWKNLLGLPPTDCDAILKSKCEETVNCSALVPLDTSSCSNLPGPPSPCNTSLPECGRDPVFGSEVPPGCGAVRSAAQDALNACNSTHANAVAAARQGCVSGITLAVETKRRECELNKPVLLAGCEVDKVARFDACNKVNYFEGDALGFVTINLFRRAFDEDPMIPKIYVPPMLPVLDYGSLGEAELATNTEIRIQEARDGDSTGNDLNLIVLLLMSKLRHPTPVSLGAVSRYANARPHSFGSYLRQYHEKYGRDWTDIANRIKDSGWKPDTDASPALGALRWYNRASKGANPRLAELYAPILAAYIK